MDWVVKAKDPKLMVHPVLILMADLVWSRVALRSFIQRKSWFIFTLLVFVTSQSIIKGLAQDDQDNESLRFATFALRIFIYLFSMGQMIFSHMGRVIGAYRKGDVERLGKCAIPKYLTNWQDAFNFVLMCVLVLIMSTEPILHCLSNEDVDMFATICPEIANISETYYALNMVAMILYYTLLLDLAVFNNRVSAYVLVCGRMLVEIALFLLAMASVLLMLSSALSCLKQSDKAFKTIPAGFQSLWEMMLGMFSTDHYKSLHDEPVVLCGVYFFPCGLLCLPHQPAHCPALLLLRRHLCRHGRLCTPEAQPHYR